MFDWILNATLHMQQTQFKKTCSMLLLKTIVTYQLTLPVPIPDEEKKVSSFVQFTGLQIWCKHRDLIHLP